MICISYVNAAIAVLGIFVVLWIPFLIILIGIKRDLQELNRRKR